MNTGIVGSNWEDPASSQRILWNGHDVVLLQREYEDWRNIQLAEEQVITAIACRVHTSPSDRHQALRTSEAEVLAALRALADAVVVEVKRRLEPILSASPEELEGLTLSLSRCAESPLLACVFEGPVALGASCVFCRLAYR